MPGPRTGRSSILKSPLWITTPCGVVKASAQASGMEWVTAMNSARSGEPVPAGRASPGATSRRSAEMPASVSRPFTMASVKRVPKTGTARWRSRKGRAPTWSSWPWVRKTAPTCARRSRSQVRSGTRTSTPERLVGEEHAAVDHGDATGRLDGQAVHAHLAEAAERDDADRGGHGGTLPRAGAQGPLRQPPPSLEVWPPDRDGVAGPHQETSTSKPPIAIRLTSKGMDPCMMGSLMRGSFMTRALT